MLNKHLRGHGPRIVRAPALSNLSFLTDGQLVNFRVPHAGSNIITSSQQAFVGGFDGNVEGGTLGQLFRTNMPAGWGQPGNDGPIFTTERVLNGNKALLNDRVNSNYQFGIRWDTGAPRRVLFTRFSYYLHNLTADQGQYKAWRSVGSLGGDGGVGDGDIANAYVVFNQYCRLNINDTDSHHTFPASSGAYANSWNPASWHTGSELWHYENEWVTLEIAFTANSAPGVADGAVHVVAYRENTGEMVCNHWGNNIVFAVTPTSPQSRYHVWQGWIGNGFDTTCKLFMDRDIYGSYSDNTTLPKFLILGNAATFNQCTVRTVAKFEDWFVRGTNGDLYFRVNKGRHADLNNLYLYVMSAPGTPTSQQGIRLRRQYFPVSVNGSGFGVGPEVVLFDRFDDQNLGETVNREAIIGQWNENPPPLLTGRPPIVSFDGRYGVSHNDPNNGSTRYGLNITNLPQHTKYLHFFKVGVPEGKHFPGGQAPETFNLDDSTFKMTWHAALGDHPAAGTGRPDLVSLTFTPNVTSVGNNVGGVSRGSSGFRSHWVWNRWNSIREIHSPDSAVVTGPNGKYNLNVHNANGMYSSLPASYAAFQAINGPLNAEYFDRLSFMSWSGNASMANAQAIFSYAYLAIGLNADKHILLGNAPTLAECTNAVDIVVPDAWTDTKIDFTLTVEELFNNSHYFIMQDQTLLASGEINPGGNVLLVGDVITIDGNNFGAGNIPLIFCDFESGLDGASLNSLGFEVSSDNGCPVPVVSTAHKYAGTRCGMANCDNAGNSAAFLQGLNANEIYVSMHLKGVLTSGAPETLKGVRAHGVNGPNVYTRYPGFMVQEPLRFGSMGHRFQINRTTTAADYEVFDEPTNLTNDTWYRQQHHYRLGSPGVADGFARYWRDTTQELNQNNIITQASGVNEMLDILMLPFYWGNSGSGRFYYDLVCINKGPNSAARVEIGDNAVYASCTKRELLETTLWSNNRVRAKLHKHTFSPGPAWLHVINASHTVVRSIPVNIG